MLSDLNISILEQRRQVYKYIKYHSPKNIVHNLINPCHF